MKKAIAFVLAVCISLLLAVPAFADGRGPAFTSYDVVCTKQTPYFREDWEKDDAPMEQKGTFPAGTKLTVDYEYEKDGVTYGSVGVGEGEDYEWMYIRVSDVQMESDTYLPKEDMKLPEARSVRVIGRGGIPMYAGPNDERYQKVANIPRGTKLTYVYANDEEEEYRTWAYVSYLNRSGWIYVYTCDRDNGIVDLPDTDGKAEIWVFGDDVKMYDGMSFGNIKDLYRDYWDEDSVEQYQQEEPDRVIMTLEKGKKYTYRYSHGFGLYEYPEGTWYYVTSGLRSGWVYAPRGEASGVAVPSENRYNVRMTYKPGDLKLYETPDEKAKSATLHLDKETHIDPEFELYTGEDIFLYVTVNGRSGWYKDDDAYDFTVHKVDEPDIGRGYIDKNYSKTAAPIYSDAMNRSKELGSIPAGKDFTPLYYGVYETEIDDGDSTSTYFYYARYNDVTGWVLEKDLEDLMDEDASAPEDETEAQDEIEDETEADDAFLEDAQDEDAPDDAETVEETAADDVFDAESYVSSTRSAGPMRIILICVVAGAVLALTAVVTLMLIRRKRAQKAEDETTITIE